MDFWPQQSLLDELQMLFGTGILLQNPGFCSWKTINVLHVLMADF